MPGLILPPPFNPLAYCVCSKTGGVIHQQKNISSITKTFTGRITFNYINDFLEVDPVGQPGKSNYGVIATVYSNDTGGVMVCNPDGSGGGWLDKGFVQLVSRNSGSIQTDPVGWCFYTVGGKLA